MSSDLRNFELTCLEAHMEYPVSFGNIKWKNNLIKIVNH